MQQGTALRTKIRAWYEVQQLYCPGACSLRSRQAQAGPVDAPLESAFAMKLWLPSMVAQQADCDERLREHEWSLRYAQAHDSLQAIRSNLQLRTSLYHYKDRFDRGQRALTRSMNLIEKLKNKIDAAALRYRVARHALAVLAPLLVKGFEWETVLRPLNPQDIRGLSVGDMGDSEGRRTLSWIWTVQGVAADASEDEQLHDCK